MAGVARRARRGRPRRPRGRPLVRGEATRDPKAVLRGRLEALGPVFVEAGSTTRRCCCSSRPRASCCARASTAATAWCDRRLLARIHRYTLDRLRREIEPVTAAQFLRFLACWQHVDPEHRLDGPARRRRGRRAARRLRGPGGGVGGQLLPARVRGYKREWLDQLTLSGEVAWGRLWGAGASRRSAARRSPSCRARTSRPGRRSAPASSVREPGPRAAARARGVLARARRDVLPGARRGPPAAAGRASRRAWPSSIAQGRVTCDSFAGLRWLLVPAVGGAYAAVSTVGRWSLLAPRDAGSERRSAEFVARQLLRRTGVVFRTHARAREACRCRGATSRARCRTLEARGEIRGGRFVAGFDGEQYALPEAVTLLRDVRAPREGATAPAAVTVSAADPLNFRGILTPDERVAPTTRRQVLVA